MTVEIKGVESVKIRADKYSRPLYESGLSAMAGSKPEPETITKFTINTYFLYLIIFVIAVIYFSFK